MNKKGLNRKAGGGIFRSRNAKECLFVIFITFLISCFSSFVSADTLYWVGGSNGNWSDSSNWASSSGGTGGAGVPNVTNAVIFNSANLNNSMINDSVAVYNLTISGYTGTISFATNVSADLNITQNFYLGSGATISPTYSSLTADGGNGTGRIISVGGNATILGTINGDGLGFPASRGPGYQSGGPSYGGRGSGGVSVYGSLAQPTSLGSASSDELGGGAIKINVTGILNLTGVISTNGQTYNPNRGAAGGSVWLISNTFIGNGTIRANGGGGSGAGGSGGRVAIEYTASTYTGTVSVANAGSTSQSGTLWEPNRFVNMASGNIVINSSYHYYFPNTTTNYLWNLTLNGASVYFHNGTMNITNLIVTNGSTLRFDVNDSGGTGVNQFQMARLSITNNINLTGSSNLYLPAEGSYNLAGNLDVASGSTLYSVGNSTVINAQSGGTVASPHGIGVGINCQNATILGNISAGNLGFPVASGSAQGPGYGGFVGSYGGKGGGNGLTYGSLIQPTALGTSSANNPGEAR